MKDTTPEWETESAGEHKWKWLRDLFQEAYTNGYRGASTDNVDTGDFSEPYRKAAAQIIKREQAHTQRIKERIEGMRRTDETQMSHDHTYDEALDDVLKILED